MFSVTGGVQPVEPDWSVRGFDAYSPGGIVAHHLAAGLLGVFAGIFHLSCRPSFALYILLRMGNIETVLAVAVSSVRVGLGTIHRWHRGDCSTILFEGGDGMRRRLA